MLVTCEKCNNTMEDVRAQKTNPNGPDFKCKTYGCKFQKNRQTGAWEPSQYKTARWLDEVMEDSESGDPTAPVATPMTVVSLPTAPQPVKTSTPYMAGPKVTKEMTEAEMWESKDRMTMKMSAWKSACDLYSGTGNEVAVRKLQQEIYNSVVAAKTGPIPTDDISLDDIPF